MAFMDFTDDDAVEFGSPVPAPAPAPASEPSPAPAAALGRPKSMFGFFGRGKQAGAEADTKKASTDGALPWQSSGNGASTPAPAPTAASSAPAPVADTGFMDFADDTAVSFGGTVSGTQGSQEQESKSSEPKPAPALITASKIVEHDAPLSPASLAPSSGGDSLFGGQRVLTAGQSMLMLAGMGDSSDDSSDDEATSKVARGGGASRRGRGGRAGGRGRNRGPPPSGRPPPSPGGPATPRLASSMKPPTPKTVGASQATGDASRIKPMVSFDELAADADELVEDALGSDSDASVLSAKKPQTRQLPEADSMVDVTDIAVVKTNQATRSSATGSSRSLGDDKPTAAAKNATKTNDAGAGQPKASSTGGRRADVGLLKAQREARRKRAADKAAEREKAKAAAALQAQGVPTLVYMPGIGAGGASVLVPVTVNLPPGSGAASPSATTTTTATWQPQLATTPSAQPMHNSPSASPSTQQLWQPVTSTSATPYGQPATIDIASAMASAPAPGPRSVRADLLMEHARVGANLPVSVATPPPPAAAHDRYGKHSSEVFGSPEPHTSSLYSSSLRDGSGAPGPIILSPAAAPAAHTFVVFGGGSSTGDDSTLSNGGIQANSRAYTYQPGLSTDPSTVATGTARRMQRRREHLARLRAHPGPDPTCAIVLPSPHRTATAGQSALASSYGTGIPAWDHTRPSPQSTASTPIASLLPPPPPPQSQPLLAAEEPHHQHQKPPVLSQPPLPTTARWPPLQQQQSASVPPSSPATQASESLAAIRLQLSQSQLAVLPGSSPPAVPSQQDLRVSMLSGQWSERPAPPADARSTPPPAAAIPSSSIAPPAAAISGSSIAPPAAIPASQVLPVSSFGVLSPLHGGLSIALAAFDLEAAEGWSAADIAADTLVPSLGSSPLRFAEPHPSAPTAPVAVQPRQLLMWSGWPLADGSTAAQGPSVADLALCWSATSTASYEGWLPLKAVTRIGLIEEGALDDAVREAAVADAAVAAASSLAKMHAHGLLIELDVGGKCGARVTVELWARSDHERQRLSRSVVRLRAVARKAARQLA